MTNEAFKLMNDGGENNIDIANQFLCIKILSIFENSKSVFLYEESNKE